jgi:hypothetical protein
MTGLHDIGVIESMLVGQSTGKNRGPGRDMDDFSSGSHTRPGPTASHLCDVRQQALLAPLFDQFRVPGIQTNKENTIFPVVQSRLGHQADLPFDPIPA